MDRPDGQITLTISKARARGQGELKEERLMAEYGTIFPDEVEVPAPEVAPTAPPLPVLLRVPRFVPEEAPRPEPMPAVPVARKRRGSRLPTRLALVLLLGATATPWVMRWRPWQLLAPLVQEQEQILHAGGTTVAPPNEPVHRMPPEVMGDPFIERAQKTPAVAPAGGARLTPDIVPLEADNGGSR
jgi:hypothetical protein